MQDVANEKWRIKSFSVLPFAVPFMLPFAVPFMRPLALYQDLGTCQRKKGSQGSSIKCETRDNSAAACLRFFISLYIRDS